MNIEKMKVGMKKAAIKDLIDKVNDFSKKTGIDITKEVVVLENEDVLGTLAKEAIEKHGFGLDGARNYNFKIISIAQKADD